MSLFGQYLVEQQKITLDQLNEAVNYQRQHNPAFGEICVEAEILSQADVDDILRELHAYRGRMLTGEIAVFLGKLTQQQVIEVLDCQRDVNLQLGDALVALGLMPEADIEAELETFEETRTQF